MRCIPAHKGLPIRWGNRHISGQMGLTGAGTGNLGGQRKKAPALYKPMFPLQTGKAWHQFSDLINRM